MEKKILSVLLVVAMVFGLCMPIYAATTMKLTGATYPTTLKQGDPFVAKGVITSDYYIRKVVIGVYNSSGAAEFDYTGLPGEKSYDINNVDYLLSFSKLKNGSYTYKIVASDDNSSDVVLLNKSFTVTSTGQTASTLKITNAKYPDTLDVGEGFSATGIVSSNYNITKIVIGAYKADGTKGFEYVTNPNAKSYDVKDADYSLPFSKLSAGSYTFKIVASDTQTSNVELLSKAFTVGTVSASTLKITNANSPTKLDVGEGFSVTGIVSSNYSISKVVIGAYKSDGTKGFEYTATPGAKSYDISNVDYLLTFSKLGAGTYTYKIVASDSQTTNVVLLNKSFTVGSSSSVTNELKKVKWDVADISYWNSDSISSWSKIAADLDAIILRIGFSYTGSKKMEEDESFASYYNNAKKNKIPVGVYYFAAATTANEASKEADFVINLLKKYKCQLEMPVYYDLETEDQVDLTQAQCTAVARAFCDKLEAAGYFVGIYCNKYFARDELYASKLSDFQFWIAEYNSSCTYNGAYGMWQYTETGWVSGLDRRCDKNYCYYDYPTYIKANGLNGFTKPQPAADPQFSLKAGSNLSLNESKKTVYLKKDPELTQNQFVSKYVTYKDVTIKATGLASGGKVATGTAISATGNGKNFGPYTICLIGDINSDSKINSADALLILQHSVGLTTLKGHNLTAADWNSDGKVNSSDALEVLRFSVTR